MRAALLALFWMLAAPALAQNIGDSPASGAIGQFFLTTGVTNFVVPQGVSMVHVDGCAAGGGNGLGQASANTAGGGGGGAGMCAQSFPLSVTPGATLVVTVGAGVANGTGGSTTITGANNPFPALSGGLPGLIGGGVTPGVGGVGGAGAGPLNGAGGAAAGTGSSPTFRGQAIVSGGGGGGGGSTASAGGVGGTGGTFGVGGGGAGNGSGGGGSASAFGNGGTGGTNGNPGITPTLGFGGGAGGNGTNSATTVAGAQGFVVLKW